MTSRTIAVTVLSLAAFAGSARAGSKPTTAEAKKTVAAWIEAMAFDQGNTSPEPASAEAIALTAVPFHAAAYNEPEPGCAYTATTDAATTAAALRCLIGNVAIDGAPKAWTKKMFKANGLPYRHKKELRALAKTATLLMQEECAGEGDQTVFAVIKDKDGTLKVAALLTQHIFCGE
jgi:hypothetical protein